ncbi:alpha/beta hydrolase family protein [Sphingomonas hylomeconis]|uniref:S9 family peptidase n=1 Tax=Sphingomonas hylomeconis TaxID=1395958 RepID=A0ABV7SRD7_9SPHN|nr:S9 family peptidase [Sphingomonas hylomeconis]
MKLLLRLLATSVMIPLSSGAAPRQLTATEAAAAFGARERIETISLSPDGNRAALLGAAGGASSALTIVDLVAGTTSQPIARSSGNPESLSRCSWVTDARLLCNVFYMADIGMKISATRQIAINSDGSGMKMITVDTNARSQGLLQNGGNIIDLLPTGEPGKVLMSRTFVPEGETGSNIVSNREGLGVELVDITRNTRKIVESPRPDATEYISDGHGTIRIRGMRPKTNGGYDGARIDYSYRQVNSDKWLPFGKLMVGGGVSTGFDPYAVDAGLNVVYGFEREGGRGALFRVSLDGSMKRELVFARADVDIDGLVRIGRQRRVVGASYATDRRQTEFFDPELKKLGASLAKALPGKPLISFVDASTDESKLLMFAGSDVDPGRYYLLDKKTRQMAEVLPVRPELADVALATVTAVNFPAADGTIIPGYLTLPPGSDGKNLPAIVMPHGGPGARDEWGFDWLAQFYANRGFAVLQPNFRGSTGYGDAWFRENGFKSWQVAIGDVNDGGRWLIKQGIADPTKLGIVGWSYGGYAALQTAVLDPNLFKAIVAIAPVTDLETLRGESRDYSNFALVDAFIGNGPHVRQGSPALNAARIKAPVLLFHGTQDLNVGVAESRLMANRLRDAGKTVEYVEFKGLDHQLDDSAARAQMLEKSDAFLRKALGM